MIDRRLFIDDTPLLGLKPYFRRPLSGEYLIWVQRDLADRLTHPRAQEENETRAAYEQSIESDNEHTEALLRLVSWELKRRGVDSALEADGIVKR